MLLGLSNGSAAKSRLSTQPVARLAIYCAGLWAEKGSVVSLCQRPKRRGRTSQSTEDRALCAEGLSVNTASVVGAGDSFLGALTYSLAQNEVLEIALRFGVAAGSAALLRPGTDLCWPEDVKRLVCQVIVRPPASTG